MKRILSKFFIIFIILLFILLIYKNIPVGFKRYAINNMNIELPSSMYIKNYNCEKKITNNKNKKICLYEIEFSTLKNKWIINNSMENLIKKNKIRICNNKNEIYIKNNNISIEEYSVRKNLLMTKVYIKLYKGEKSDNQCFKINDFKKINYIVYKQPEHRITPEEFKYLNNDGKIYTIHYKSNNDILFNYGNNKYKYLDHLLQFGWLSMEDIINYLEYKSSIKEFKKSTYFSGDNILYENNDFKLLKCNNKTNKDIYFFDDLDKKINYCNN